ncbi:MAG TPA: ECF transporter S component [Candidatus Ruminococcus avistercoris]|nr:ECF transporter S component [Candidatus Ruminococcus avistercoris]
MNVKSKKLTMIGMLCAVAYIVMVVGRFPVVLFLKYDPKDVVITIGGFIFGPMTSFLISLIVSLIEMVTVSETGPIGCIMNILSTCCFACTAAFIYKKQHTMKGAITGLVAGCLLTTAVMLLWNYLITPIYMGYPREAVAELLLPAFLPFNLLKGGLNTVIILLIYKPIVTALRKAGFLETTSPQGAVRQRRTGIMLVCAVLLITLIFLMLVLRGIA